MSPKNSRSGIEIVPEGSRAIAEAGKGRCSKTATAPTGSPGPRISRIRSRSGAALTILTRPTKRKWMKSAGSPSSKRMAPLSKARSSQSGSSAARSSAERGARMGTAENGTGGRTGTRGLSHRQSRDEGGLRARGQPARLDRRTPTHRAHQVEHEEHERQNHGDAHVRADLVENGPERRRILQQPHRGAEQQERVRRLREPRRPEPLAREHRQDPEAHADDQQRQEPDREDVTPGVGPPEVLGRDPRRA